MQRRTFIKGAGTGFVGLSLGGSALANTTLDVPDPRISPEISDAITWTGYDIPEGVATYTTAAHPGLFVTVEEAGDLDSLTSWIDASDDRALIKTWTETQTALIAVPMMDVGHPFASLSRFSAESTLLSLGYVDGVSFDRQVGLPDRVSLTDSSAWTAPAGATIGRLAGGRYKAKDMAWGSDAPEVDLLGVRDLLGVNEVSATGAGVTVAVIDSGVNFGDGELYGDGTAGSEYRVGDAYDFVTDTAADLTVARADQPAELETVADGNGHGSWVSSAILNADSGMAPGASLLAYRALNDEGQGSTSDIVDAINRATDQGADLLCMSLGSMTYSDAMARALTRALTEGVTGAFIAAGNSYLTTRWLASPADVQAVITVSATNAVAADEARKAYFANVGPDSGLDGSGTGEYSTRGVLPDIAAPGMSISAPVFTGTGTQRNSRLSGTSMAAPLACGVGALLLEADSSLRGQPEEFRDVLVNSGAHTPDIGLTESQGGLVDADRAINGYAGDDAPDRDLSDNAAARDTGNRWLIGDVGLKISTISQALGGLR